MDLVWPNMTLECLLAADNEPDPLPDFSFRVERILVSSSTGFETQQIHMQMPINDSILQLNETDLLSLFDVDTESINITCIVSNTFGSDMATTVITVCGINFIALTNTPYMCCHSMEYTKCTSAVTTYSTRVKPEGCMCMVKHEC